MSLLSFGHCIITSATFHCIILELRTRHGNLGTFDQIWFRSVFRWTLFSLVITEVSTCCSKIFSAPQILVSAGFGADWIFCRVEVLVCKINGWLSTIKINYNLRGVWLGTLVRSLGQELADLATNNRLVDALVVNNLWPSSCILSQLSGANISER